MRSAGLNQAFVVSIAILSLILPSFSRADGPTGADAGKFIITLQGGDIGTDEFTMTADGQIEINATVTLGGNKIEFHDHLSLPKGKLSAFTTEAGKNGTIAITIANGAAKTLVDGKPFKDTKVPAGVLPFGNFTPQLFSYLVSEYDGSKGGEQKLDVVGIDGIGPDGLAVLKVTLAAQPDAVRTVSGKKLTLHSYALTLPGAIGNLDTQFYADAQGRILYWNVPGQGLHEVREGYEDLALPEKPEDPLLSKAIYTIKIDHDVKIAMRDGVKLAADIYRPDAPGKYPVILQRTPYGRENAVEAAGYAKRGYVFVAQDVRGRFDSEGEFHPFVLEAKDGYDSIEWCAVQPWSTGNIGMIGGSYLGFAQWAAARENNPHLKCIIPIVSPPDAFFNVPYMFGEIFLAPDLWWASVVKSRNSVNIQPPIKAMKNMNAFKTLPLSEVDKAVLGEHSPIFQEWLKHSTNDAYYDQSNFDNRMDKIGPLPALNVSGWFDGDGIGTKLNYAGMIATGHENQKLIYGPWSHAVNTTSKLGKLDFGPQSLRDLDTLYIRWFDRWLKGVQNGVEKEPPVDVFIMGRNEWRSFAAWPPKSAEIQKWYFHSAGDANSSNKGGTLSRDLPGSGEPADLYTYNPADPYIPLGAAALSKAAKAEPGDEGGVEMPDKRQDTLSYETPVLTHDLIVAGPISVHLTASSSAKDTDWFASLQDMYPDGHVDTLNQGIIRARFRKSFTTPELLSPGEICDYTIDLWALGNAFKAGHRLRVLVSSSYFPVYARNLNTGGDIGTDKRMVIAHQKVYHTADHPSYIVLPVLEK